ncbi:MAG: DNA primase, partial [Alphaproteobacteria bacterium]|nr:DNA primase [Alphaproteobacteria bacterium]
MPRFTPDFLDELKARLRPSDVIGRYVKLKKQGNEWAGLSPFTKEKTPSFFVNDNKGFYHCFSSGKHGDVISFLQETQRMSFHEAVEKLAEEAGLPLPAETPGDAARAQKAQGLAEACAAAAQYFAAMLHRSDGRHALEYLRGREITEAQIKQFTIGYAPKGRGGLKDFLINKGFSDDVLIEAGLTIKPDDGSASFDRFRNRIMFPITGPRDRVIAFGGRALDPDARAKYLNSPATPLFHKGSVLYNLNTARMAAADAKAPLIVCEGYMDVIALWGAGFKHAVAPLGTALTEDQLTLLWRASDE